MKFLDQDNFYTEPVKTVIPDLAEVKDTKTFKSHRTHKDSSELIPESLKHKLSIMAGVTEDKYQLSDNSVTFDFTGSLHSNKCQIIQYNGKYIVEFRKITDNLLEGKMNKLISEKIIDEDDLQDHFENYTGIYLSFLEN